MVPLVTHNSTPSAPLSTTTRAQQWRVALVAGMLLLLLLFVMVVVVGGGGVVGRKPEEGSVFTTTAADLDYCDNYSPNFRCRGTSVTTDWGKQYLFETCYKFDHHEEQ